MTRIDDYPFARVYAMRARIGDSVIGYDIAIPWVEVREQRHVAAMKLREARKHFRHYCAQARKDAR